MGCSAQPWPEESEPQVEVEQRLIRTDGLDTTTGSWVQGLGSERDARMMPELLSLGPRVRCNSWAGQETADEDAIDGSAEVAAESNIVSLACPEAVEARERRSIREELRCFMRRDEMLKREGALEPRLRGDL